MRKETRACPRSVSFRAGKKPGIFTPEPLILATELYCVFIHILLLFFLKSVLVTVALLWRYTMTKVIFIKESIEFKGLLTVSRVSPQSSWWRAWQQAGVVLGKKLRPTSCSTSLELTSETSKLRPSHTPPPTRPCFLQQCHTSSKYTKPYCLILPNNSPNENQACICAYGGQFHPNYHKTLGKRVGQ